MLGEVVLIVGCCFVFPAAQFSWEFLEILGCWSYVAGWLKLAGLLVCWYEVTQVEVCWFAG